MLRHSDLFYTPADYIVWEVLFQSMHDLFGGTSKTIHSASVHVHVSFFFHVSFACKFFSTVVCM
jgi:hypothetical protein